MVTLSQMKKGGNTTVKRRETTVFIITAATIAAAYVVCTMLLSSVSFGVVQLRIAEVMTVLPYFSWAPVWGLFVGCAVSNLLFSFMPLDFAVGSIATLIAALLTRALKNHKWLAPLPPVIVNAVMIGGLLTFYTAGGFPTALLLTNIGIVAAGQAIVCYGMGLPLLIMAEKRLSKKPGMLR